MMRFIPQGNEATVIIVAAIAIVAFIIYKIVGAKQEVVSSDKKGKKKYRYELCVKSLRGSFTQILYSNKRYDDAYKLMNHSKSIVVNKEGDIKYYTDAKQYALFSRFELKEVTMLGPFTKPQTN